MSIDRQAVKKWAWEHLKESFDVVVQPNYDNNPDMGYHSYTHYIPRKTVDQLLDLTITRLLDLGKLL